MGEDAAAHRREGRLVSVCTCRINWGVVLLDLALLGAAVYSSYFVILWLCLFTGSLTLKCAAHSDD